MGETGQSEDTLGKWLRDGGLATLDRFVGGSKEAIGVIDTGYILRYVNWTVPGISRGSMVGQSVFSMLPPSYEGEARACFDRVLSSGEPDQFETISRNEQGELVWIARVAPIKHAGKVIGVFTINTDVTEERRGSLDRDRFFSLSLDMLVVVSQGGLLRRVNPAFAETLGYSSSEVIGRSFAEFVHPDDVENSSRAFFDLVEGNPFHDFENRYRRKDGTYRTFSWRATVDPVTSDVYAVARDVTEYRATELQLMHAKKMEAVGQLAGGIAHDFNNLMQAVLANVEEALQTTQPSPTILEHLHEIEDATVRAAELTKQLLVFSRRQPLRPTPVDLNELLCDLMRMLRRLLPESITIDFVSDSRIPAAHADQTQVEQVVVNLCVNARDAMTDGGKITLETSDVVFGQADQDIHPWTRPGHFVRLSVSDTGAGMSPEVLERVFDPFFSTKSEQKGTGLGLATLYGIVQQHGGMVRAQSTPGVGTSFAVYLPASEEETSIRLVERSLDAPGGRETILIAEDEEVVRKPVLRLLQRAGYSIHAASNGLEAIALVEQHWPNIDLVVLDVVMPKLGGVDAWERIHKAYPRLDVLFMTGYADAPHRDRIPAEAGVIDKPFRSDEFLRGIRTKLERKAKLPPMTSGPQGDYRRGQ